MSTRNTIERCFGVLKNRFYALRTGLRVREMAFAGKLIICAAIVHNLCVDSGDDGRDLDDGGNQDPDVPQDPPPENFAQNETSWQQLLRYFQ